MAKPQKLIKSIRLSEAGQKEYAELYGSTYAGATKAAEAFIHLRLWSLDELKGKLTPAELRCIIDAQPGLFNEIFFYPQVELFAYKMKNYTGKLKEDIPDYRAFIKRISSLTSAQVYFLQDEIYRFLNNDSYFLDEFIKLLS